MSQKRLETVGGAFVTYDRATLKTAKRSELQSYLEARGFAVYSSEKTAELREAALEDFDGEKSVMNEHDLRPSPRRTSNIKNEPKTAAKPPLVFHEHNSKQATKDDLLDVCRALGLKVTTNSAPLASVRLAMRSRLIELNEAGILPPDEDI